MKHSHHLAIYLMVVLFLIPSANGQTSGNTIYNITPTITKYPIVRAVDKMTYVIFYDDGGTNYFALFDIGSNTFKRHPVNNLIVNDMEVVGKHVYFCGKQGGIVVVGLFNFNDLFNGNSNLFI